MTCIILSRIPDTLALFADDAKCLLRIRSTEDCLTLQSVIDKLTECSETCKLSYNIQKCSITTMTRKHTPIYFNYTIRDQTLKRVEFQRDLESYVQVMLVLNIFSRILSVGRIRCLGLFVALYTGVQTYCLHISLCILLWYVLILNMPPRSGIQNLHI